MRGHLRFVCLFAQFDGLIAKAAVRRSLQLIARYSDRMVFGAKPIFSLTCCIELIDEYNFAGKLLTGLCCHRRNSYPFAEERRIEVSLEIPSGASSQREKNPMTEKPSVTLPGIVQKIIKPVDPKAPEKALTSYTEKFESRMRCKQTVVKRSR